MAMRRQVLEPPDEAFDEVASSVGFVVEGEGFRSCGGGWDDGADAALLEPFAQRVGVICLVSNEPLGSDAADVGPFEQQDDGGDVGDVAGCEHEGYRSTATIGQAMDFRRPAAPRAPDRLFVLPVLRTAPAAERWARTWVESIISSSGRSP